MVDTAGELMDGMRDIRVRQAVLVTALLKLGGRLPVTHKDAFDAAAYDIEVRPVEGGLDVSLKAAKR